MSEFRILSESVGRRRSPHGPATNQARLKLEVGTMEALLEKLGMRLREWNPETDTQVRQVVAEIIDLADHDALDLVRSRAVEQEVLDIIDEFTSR